MLLLYFFAFWKDIIDNIVSYIPYYVTRTSANGSAAVSFSHKLHVPWDIGADQHYIHQSKLLTQNHVNTISEWTRSNKIMLNSAKSNNMMFTRRYGLLCTRLNLESNILEKVSATYLLGVDKWRFRLGTKYFRVVQKGIFSNILAVQIEICWYFYSGSTQNFYIVPTGVCLCGLTLHTAGQPEKCRKRALG